MFELFCLDQKKIIERLLLNNYSKQFAIISWIGQSANTPWAVLHSFYSLYYSPTIVFLTNYYTNLLHNWELFIALKEQPLSNNIFCWMVLKYSIPQINTHISTCGPFHNQITI